MANEKTVTKIVKNSSKAYGYKYSSLADLASAGVEIPKMRVKPIDGDEYIEYADNNGEWQLGARIVVPEMRGMNAAQAYGAALTYARRYTVQLAKSIACDEDSKLEAQAPTKREFTKVQGKINIVEFKSKIEQLSDDEIRKYYARYKQSHRLTDKQQKLLENICGDVIKRRQAKLKNNANSSEDEEIVEELTSKFME